jgi:hypothetical protein
MAARHGPEPSAYCAASTAAARGEVLAAVAHASSVVVLTLAQAAPGIHWAALTASASSTPATLLPAGPCRASSPRKIARLTRRSGQSGESRGVGTATLRLGG